MRQSVFRRNTEKREKNMGSFTPIPANLLKHFDVDLQKLYHDVIQKELKFQSKKSVQKFKVALKEVVDAYRMEYGVEHSNSIRFDSPAKRCAYVLKHSPCFTSAVAKHFFRMIRANQQILHKCLHSGQLNLCCLGGGPASDAVAISKIISGVYHSTWNKTHRTLKFQVTIVDINEDWEITAKNVLDILKTSEEFFEVEGLELSFRFCRADLTEPMDVEVQEALRNADIVTMVFFLSAVNRSKAIEKGFHMVQDQARRRFVEWAQNEMAVVPDFHKRILFSDETHFWLNGYVDKQNCRIWSEANSQVYVETPLHPEKLTVWCALWDGGIIGPYFKNDEGHNVTVNGDLYRAMITNFFIRELNNHDVQELWIQQDGATCHTARATIDLLKDTLGDRLISRFGPVNWPPRSCDLTPLDYFLRGYVKSLVYVDKPQTLDHLEDNICRVIADIRPQMLEKVIENWTSTLDYIRASRGSPMPEILFKM
ncbi:transposable element Tc3 transposase [Trichonephila clavipes]|nr:transposable element Tc3 transposase [Trichonephila clavipes]